MQIDKAAQILNRNRKEKFTTKEVEEELKEEHLEKIKN